MEFSGPRLGWYLGHGARMTRRTRQTTMLVCFVSVTKGRHDTVCISRMPGSPFTHMVTEQRFTTTKLLAIRVERDVA